MKEAQLLTLHEASLKQGQQIKELKQNFDNILKVLEKYLKDQETLMIQTINKLET